MVFLVVDGVEIVAAAGERAPSAAAAAELRSVPAGPDPMHHHGSRGGRSTRAAQAGHDTPARRRVCNIALDEAAAGELAAGERTDGANQEAPTAGVLVSPSASCCCSCIVEVVVHSSTRSTPLASLAQVCRTVLASPALLPYILAAS